MRKTVFFIAAALMVILLFVFLSGYEQFNILLLGTLLLGGSIYDIWITRKKEKGKLSQIIEFVYLIAGVFLMVVFIIKHCVSQLESIPDYIDSQFTAVLFLFVFMGMVKTSNNKKSKS